MRLACGLPNGLFDNGTIASYLGAPRFSQAGAQAVHRRRRSRQRQGGAIRGEAARCKRRRVQKLDAEHAREEAKGQRPSVAYCLVPRLRR
jgi:hypothetical protein